MKHKAIKFNLLAVVLGMGAMGAPLLGPLRNTLQQEADLTRFQVGLGDFVFSLMGGIIGLVLGVTLRRVVRPTFVKAGVVTFAAGCGLLALTGLLPASLYLPLIALAWMVIFIGRPLASAANGVFADLWDSDPHAGLILLHMANAFGKVLAPVVVLVLVDAVWAPGAVYTVFFGLLAVHALFWPTETMEHLTELERSRDVDRKVRLPSSALVWVCAAQFAIIAGAESGATVILGEFVRVHRPSPFEALTNEAWGRAAILIMLSGIVLGRVVFALLARWMRPRQIVRWCLACLIFAVPAALHSSPWVYAPSLCLLGIAFSATWPAFFGIVAHAYPHERTFLSFAAGLANVVGMGVMNMAVGGIGNVDSRLAWAFLAGPSGMLLFVLFLFGTPWGRNLEEVRAEVEPDSA
jgi:fucose permease